MRAAPFIGGDVGVFFPIRFGGGKVELLFVFEGAQGVEFRIVGRGAEEFGEFGARFLGRAADRNHAAGQ